MSILPRWHNGRICVPWWYGLGYSVWWAVLVILGIKAGYNMTMDLETTTVIALVAASFLGALSYFVLASVSKYEKQKADAEQVKTKVASSGRDPEDLAALTPAERWEITKCAKFDRIFLIADFIGIILGTACAVAVLYFFGDRYLADDYAEYAVAGVILGIVASVFVDNTLIKYAAAGEWSKKSAEAFHVVKSVVEDAVEVKTGGGFDALVKKYIDAGLSKREAREMAKDAVVANPDLLKEE